jgi:hypothetical protein
MELQEFLVFTLEPDRHLRTGQKMITYLGDVRPDLYEKLLRHSLSGCYYTDEKIWALVEWLKNNW